MQEGSPTPFERSDAVDLLCRALREGPFSWPVLSAGEAEQLYVTACEEGVHLLLAHRLWQRGPSDRAGAVALRDRLTAALRQQVAAEEIIRPELQSVLAALAGAGVRGVVIKGGALAYTHYPAPVLRPRVDTDILIPAASRPRAIEALQALNYGAVPVTSGELVSHQASYARTDRGGARHVVDVHWQVSNPRVFARALPADEVLAASIPVPQLGDPARAPSAAHGLAIACVHRLAHHAHGDRLVWLYDIHLLAEGLTGPERDAFAAYAVARQLSAVCMHGLEAARRCFGGEGIAHLLRDMARHSEDALHEPSAVFAAKQMRRRDVLLSDLAALEGWRAKLTLVREHLFPPREYMRRRYGIKNWGLLPCLYAWRILWGGAAWLSPSGPPRDGE